MYRSRINIYYSDVIMGVMTSQITSLAIVYWTAFSGADQRKHQCSASLAFVRRIHRWPVNSPHKWPVTRKMFPFDDVIVIYGKLGVPAGFQALLSGRPSTGIAPTTTLYFLSYILCTVNTPFLVMQQSSKWSMRSGGYRDNSRIEGNYIRYEKKDNE